MSNRLSTWVYATRPHTLGASIAPMLVVLGALIAEGVFDFLPYLCAILVALSAQITSNFANDYFDYKGEIDTDKRVGFRRVLVTGEVTPREMLIAMLISTGVTILSGLAAVLLTGAWWLIAVGLLVLFYGMTPILATYGAIGGTPPLYLLLLSVGIGIWEDNILVCNNYRDYAEDRESGKQTIIVRMGERFGPTMYLLNSLLTVILLVVGIYLATESLGLTAIVLSIAPLIAALTACIYRWHGSELNKLLKYTNIVSLVIGLVLLILQIL